MCFTIYAATWARQIHRARIERTSYERRSQDTQNPCPDLFCSGHRQSRHWNRRHRDRQVRVHLRAERHARHGRACRQGLIDLAAGVAGIKGANKPSQVDGAFKLGIVAALATIAQAVLTLPAFGGDAINYGAFVIVVYDLFFVQQAHAVKAENKDRL